VRRLPAWPARLAPHLLFLIPELLIATGPFVIQSVATTAGRTRFRMPDFFYGGQALIEGVMMRGRTTVAMSVRPPDGSIRTYSEDLAAGVDPKPPGENPLRARNLRAVRDPDHRYSDADALGGDRGRG